MDFDNMLRYCAALRDHNDRSWFHENHDWYEAAKGDFLRLLEQLRFALAGAAPALADSILYLPVKDWVYRIARDMRFYRDRPPYDPSFRAYLSADRKSWLPIGYFLCIAPEASLFGTGLFCESTKALNQVRDYVALHQQELEDIVAAGDLYIQGDQLKTVPRGYDKDHPAARWLRYKNWMCECRFPDEALTSFDALENRVRDAVRRMEPLRLYLLDAASGVDLR